MFYYGYSDSRWWNGTYSQWTDCTFTCSQLPRYANFTENRVSAIGINYVSVTWGADSSCSGVWYSLNGGGWVGATYPTYSIGGLQPNTDYNIRTIIRRSDSGLDTYSGYLYTRTAALPSSNTPGNINIGNNPTASISSMSNLEYWWYDVYDGSTLLGTSGALTSTSGGCSINDGSKTNSMLSRHSGDNDWNLTYKFYCRSNGANYTLTERTAKCIIPQNTYLPSFNSNNVSYEVTDQSTLNITGSNKKVIKGISHVQLRFTNASPNGGSNMARYVGSVGNGSYSVNAGQYNTFDFDNVEGDSYSIQAIDSRSRSSIATNKYSTYIDYSKPSITSANIVRDEGILANLKFNITGSFYKWSGLSISNSIKSITYKYKEKGTSTWSSNRNITGVTYSDNNFTINFKDNGDLLATTKDYDVQVNITDQLTTTSINTTIPTGSALIWRDLANNRIGIGKKPERTLDVKGDIASTSLQLDYGDLSFKPNSANDTGDIVFYYANGKEKSRIWTDNTYTSKKGPNYRVYKEDGSILYTGSLATGSPLDAYPIGTIYCNYSDSTSPASFIGGTWERLKGGYLYGCVSGPGQSQLTGTTTDNQTPGLPWHQHTGSTSTNGWHEHQNALNGDGGYYVWYRLNWGGSHTGYCISGNNINGQSSGASFPSIAVGNGNHNHTFTTDGAGGGSTHAHNVPYIAVWMWRRTG